MGECILEALKSKFPNFVGRVFRAPLTVEMSRPRIEASPILLVCSNDQTFHNSICNIIFIATFGQTQIIF